MQSTTANTAFWRGFRAGLPFILAVIPFGLLFGVLAIEAGLDFVQVMWMSALVIAGASQFAALAQMQDSAPVIMVVAAALIVNLRMAMYSASLAPHLIDAPLWQRAFVAYLLVDNVYVTSVSDYEDIPNQTMSEKIRYYFGTAIPAITFWFLSIFTGAWLGKAIPPEFALDFAPAIVFLAIFAPMLKTLAHLGAALTSVTVALLLAFLPYATGLLVAALVAMIVGAEIERRQGRHV